MTSQILTQKILFEHLKYCPITGDFTWIKNTSFKLIEGTKAGCLNSYGYKVIKIKRKVHYAHRLAWLYVTGKYPDGQIDHVNRIRADNRFSNLRDVSRYENHANKRNNTEFIGVTWHKKSKKWSAREPCKNNRSKSLGLYETHYAACYARHFWNISNNWELFKSEDN